MGQSNVQHSSTGMLLLNIAPHETLHRASPHHCKLICAATWRCHKEHLLIDVVSYARGLHAKRLLM